MIDGLQKMGGVAALVMAAAWVVAFAVLLGVLLPTGYLEEAATAAERAGTIADHQALISIGLYLIPYVAWGLLLVVLVLALHDRVRTGMPAVAQIASAIGLIWAGLVIASGLIATLGVRVVGALHGTDAARAGAVWAPIETVVGGLGGEAGEILGGVWLVLIGRAALRTRGLPRALSILGIALGVAGILTVVPALEPAASLYGLGLIVWFVWVGIVMLRPSSNRPPAAPAPELPTPAGVGTD